MGEYGQFIFGMMRHWLFNLPVIPEPPKVEM